MNYENHFKLMNVLNYGYDNNIKLINYLLGGWYIYNHSVKPNSKMKRVDKDGKTISERTYDNEGRAEKDIDYSNHGNPKRHPKVPHTHKWDWTNPDKPVRGKHDE